jgi:hypothetical protein
MYSSESYLFTDLHINFIGILEYNKIYTFSRRVIKIDYKEIINNHEVITCNLMLHKLVH